MSKENLHIVSTALKAASARPKPDFSTINKLYAPTHVLVPSAAGGLEQEAHGARGYQAWREETQDLMNAEFDVEGSVDLGAEKVLAVITNRVRGASSGAPTEQRAWLVITVKGGRITRTEAYTDPAKALEAAGLSE